VLVLGIETSCDETGVALAEVSPDGVITIRDEALASQVALHEAYGGVVPELASREHLKALPILVDLILSRQGITLPEITSVAVTVGPGLKGCLLVGAAFASGTGLPVIPVNHIEAHLLAAELSEPRLRAPYLSLIVSGGHTELYLVSGFRNYQLLARTRDDAAGEAFDKSAALLGFSYPGGPKLAKLADTVTGSRFNLPKVSREIADFSFSGLKTAVLLEIRKNQELLDSDSQAKAEMAFTIQEAIISSLINKLKIASREYGALPISIVGGVAANKKLRAEAMKQFPDRVFIPTLQWCVDNGAMIAFAGARTIISGVAPEALQVRGRWPITELSAHAS
jgi:N6-L-threonylcarbamoyladenine synthase